MINIYTDGSSTKNRSGWAFIAFVDNARVCEMTGCGSVGDTNQLMELTAVIEACNWAENSDYIKEHDVTIYSDSAYVINCFKDKWYVSWENNGWKNSKKETIANLSEWKLLIKYFKMPNFNFEKVKGHAGHLYNEQADALARGKASLDVYLTDNKKNDKIYIEISEILLNYSMKKFSVKETINKIIEIMQREGVNIDG